jgi:hypothetical protein
MMGDGDGDGSSVFPKHNHELKNALFLAFIVQSFTEGSADLDELHAAFVDIGEFPDTADVTVLAAKRAIEAAQNVFATHTIHR